MRYTSSIHATTRLSRIILVAHRHLVSECTSYSECASYHRLQVAQVSHGRQVERARVGWLKVCWCGRSWTEPQRQPTNRLVCIARSDSKYSQQTNRERRDTSVMRRPKHLSIRPMLTSFASIFVLPDQMRDSLWCQKPVERSWAYRVRVCHRRRSSSRPIAD